MNDSKKPSFECPICDSDIPADESESKPGGILYCSYCRITLKVKKGKGEELVVEFDEDE